MTARMNRRRFFRRTAGIASAAAPVIIPASATGRTGRIVPSERTVVGCIGVGTMGFADMGALMGISEVQVTTSTLPSGATARN